MAELRSDRRLTTTGARIRPRKALDALRPGLLRRHWHEVPFRKRSAPNGCFAPSPRLACYTKCCGASPFGLVALKDSLRSRYALPACSGDRASPKAALVRTRSVLVGFADTGANAPSRVSDCPANELLHRFAYRIELGLRSGFPTQRITDALQRLPPQSPFGALDGRKASQSSQRVAQSALAGWRGKASRGRRWHIRAVKRRSWSASQTLARSAVRPP